MNDDEELNEWRNQPLPTFWDTHRDGELNLDKRKNVHLQFTIPMYFGLVIVSEREIKCM